jgi:hypothetical protein
VVSSALVFVSASHSRWIAKSGGQGGDLAIPAKQVAQTKIMAFKTDVSNAPMVLPVTGGGLP